ncbi:YidH family protein [Aestuariimicrobium soli]|uniref:YidH family protein n=1 Tax=Aestuariimicrobium soli TaxID=2035834 RepID=UPI003EC01E0D
MTERSPNRGSGDRRFPARVYAHGSEPDPRFSLANERTFLAWMSTGLALISVGVGLEAFGLTLHHGLRLAASAVLILLGITVPVHAWFSWMRVESAMRDHRPLPALTMGLVLTVGLAIAGLLVLAAVVAA